MLTVLGEIVPFLPARLQLVCSPGLPAVFYKVRCLEKSYSPRSLYADDTEI